MLFSQEADNIYLMPRYFVSWVVVSFVCLFIVLSSLLFVSDLKANVSSCSASVSASTVTANSSFSLDFLISNTDSVNISWVKITAPNSNFTITSGSRSGWSAGVPTDNVVFTGGTLNAGDAQYFNVSGTAGAETSAASWTIQTSDDGEGANPYSCSGNLQVGIGSSGDTTAPTLSDPTVSDVADNYAKVTWTTDELSTSKVYYGTTDAYGSTAEEGTLRTTHELGLINLTANTTYHFTIRSVDAAGNEGDYGDSTFVSARGSTAVVTRVTTTTTTTTITTRTVADTVTPEALIITDLTKVFDKPPTINGKASDNSGVSRVEFSLDNAKNWLPVDKISGIGAKSVSYEFTPVGLLDGNYKIRVRVTDSSGNKAVSKEYTLVIDRLPPMVGVSFFSLGPLALSPDQRGVYFSLPKVDQRIVLSAVGGPTSIDIVAKNGAVERTQVFSLTKNPDSGLWWGAVSFSDVGIYKLTAKCVDGANNKTERVLNTIVVLPKGKVVDGETPLSDANVYLYSQDPTTKQFFLWDAQAYSQDNPVKTNSNGEYSFFPPAGTYYIEVRSGSYSQYRSAIFTITEPIPITSEFKLERGEVLKLGNLSINLPNIMDIFDTKPVTINFDYSNLQDLSMDDEKVVGKELEFALLKGESKDVSTYSLHGKPTVLTFLSSWEPQTGEQMGYLEKLSDVTRYSIVPVMIHETDSVTAIFKNRGKYKLAILSDKDGVLVDELKIKSVPTHIFLDRKGVVFEKYVGLLTDKEVLEKFSI